MAKFDEADPRWIVEERDDGRNVNNWHWTEKDCSLWARQRLGSLFNDLRITQSTSVAIVIINELAGFNGDVFMNGRMKGDNGESIIRMGSIDLPNLGDDCSSVGDIDIQVTLEQDDKQGRTIKDVIRREGKEIIWQQIMIFVKELRTGSINMDENHRDTVENILEEKNVIPKISSTDKKNDNISKRVIENDKIRTGKIFIKDEFYASPKDIYECFTNALKFQTFSRSPAKIDAKEGGEFAWFDGSIKGRFVILISDSIIEMKWKFDSWNENHFSNVILNFKSPKNGLTILEITQTDIPEEDKFGNENVLMVTETGWRMQILQNIKAVFGYGV